MPQYETPVTADLIRGALDLEPTPDGGLIPHRLPPRARKQNTDPQLAAVEVQPSGVRVAFRTSATDAELVVVPTNRMYAAAPPRPPALYDLLVDGELTAQAAATGGHTLTVDMATGATEFTEGPPGTVRFTGLPDRPKDIEIWLPYAQKTELRTLRTNAPITPPAPSPRPLWLHHGSSISHGTDAASPTAIWPAVAARLGGIDLLNLGFGGSAMLDQFTARAIRDTPADLITLKIGINIANADAMRMRAFGPAVHGFLDTIRDGHPNTPIVLISPIHCPIHETTPGPGALDTEAYAQGKLKFLATGDPQEAARGRLTLVTMREALERIVAERAEEDDKLTYLDGRDLYGPEDDDLPLPDDLHPDTNTHQRMGERFAERVLKKEGWAQML
ncbi:lipase [Streptomyces sp. V2]|uniref:GDSL-type esterase/lipase family protein n=1 Tax=Streptomyces TaxID=1883 RepID=UPI000D66F33D|nr:GDSL-type esterase/lipase family protein [Streptomyces sp. V2]PWG14068.1 lipase [Streptomyces sp. V2]